MSKRTVLRIIIPALLFAGALLIWALWPNSAQHADVPVGPPGILLVLGLIVALQSFLGDISDIPFAVWAIILLILAIGVWLFVPPAIGIFGIVGLAAIGAFFLFSQG